MFCLCRGWLAELQRFYVSKYLRFILSPFRCNCYCLVGHLFYFCCFFLIYQYLLKYSLRFFSKTMVKSGVRIILLWLPFIPRFANIYASNQHDVPGSVTIPGKLLRRITFTWLLIRLLSESEKLSHFTLIHAVRKPSFKFNKLPEREFTHWVWDCVVYPNIPKFMLKFLWNKKIVVIFQWMELFYQGNMTQRSRFL